MSSTNQDRVIEEADSNDNEIDDVGIIDINKTAKSKDLVNTRAGFFIPKARLAFIKLK